MATINESTQEGMKPKSNLDEFDKEKAQNFSTNFNVESNDQMKLLRNGIRKFAENILMPMAPIVDREAIFSWETAKELAKINAWGIEIPEKLLSCTIGLCDNDRVLTAEVPDIGKGGAEHRVSGYKPLSQVFVEPVETGFHRSDV